MTLEKEELLLLLDLIKDKKSANAKIFQNESTASEFYHNAIQKGFTLQGLYFKTCLELNKH